MRTSSAKAKGRRLAARVKEALVMWALPSLHSDDVIVTSSGETGEDIKLSPKAREIYPFAIECKNQESISIWACLKQAASNAGNYYPLLVFSRNREDVYVALKLTDFLNLYRKGLNVLPDKNIK